jgi:acetolactate synthase-1/2/3 large subunit
MTNGRRETVGAAIARYLADIGVETVFGVISIHNMPILDAIAAQGRIRFVPARGEAGAMSMADAHARVSRKLGVVITSTGTAAGNAAGAQVEALTAGTPLLHITSQVDRAYMDRDRGAIHDVPRQFDMLKAVSKTAARMWEPHGAIPTLEAAVSAAMSAPSGPVSVEVPVDIQRLEVAAMVFRAPVIQAPRAPDAAIDALAERVVAAKRPMLWLGGGARGARAAAMALMDKGFGAVSSTNGRGVVDERHPATLGAFNMNAEAEKVYAASDLMIVAGSRLRGNETRDYKLPLPPIVQIDAEATQGGRNYPVEAFIHGDAADVLARLAERLPDAPQADPEFLHSIAVARAKSEGQLRDQLGVYRVIADAFQDRVAEGGHPWVRDVTISNSTFGNRYVQIDAPHLGVHALGGGIGQGIAMGVGAGLVPGVAKAVVLLGDGGAQLGIAELITAVEERANLVYVLMNDKSYGVIKNIQDAQYDGRHVYSTLMTPDFAGLCASVGMPHRKVSSETDFADALDAALAEGGPVLVEVDMLAIGPFAQPFAGPPAGAAGKTR